MWNDWLSSLTGPSGDATDTDIPEPIETPRRFSNPHSIEKLQSLQTQHQQLQVHQLHLLNQQFKLQKELTDSGDSTCTDGGSSAPQSPSSGVSNVLAEAFKCTAGDVKPPNASGSKLKIKTEPSDVEERGMDHTSLPTEVWQQFHAIQAQQWAQALNQARLAKRSPGGVLMGGSTPLSGNLGLLTQGHVSSSGSGLSGGKRCKAYAAPKGVWKNNGGYNATIYVHKRRIYGPIRRDLSDAIEDRKEMEDALRELTAVHNSPEDAAVLEVEMREVVAGLRNRSTPGRMDVPASRLLGTQGNMMGASVITPGSNDGTRKRLRLVGPTSTPLQSPQMTHAPAESPDLMFAPPMQIKDELSLYDTSDLNGTTFMGDMLGGDNGAFGTSARIGYTPNVGPQGAPFQQNVYGTPMHTGFGSSGLDDGTLDMLPESNMWGSH